jgi:hypothetical protein
VTEGRETKAERKERARRERLALEAQVGRSRRNRTIGLVVAGAVAAAAIAFVATRPPAPEPAPEGLDAVLASSTQAQADAGCDDVVTAPPYDPESIDRAHTGGEEVAGLPALSTYPTTPPTSGPHDPNVLPAGIYDRTPDMGAALHSLEHGGVIVWYAPDAPDEDVRALVDFYSRQDVAGERVIVAPYDYPDQGEAAALPDGAQMAMVAWHRIQTCASVDHAAAFGFSARYAFPTYDREAYLGEAPEPGAQM